MIRQRLTPTALAHRIADIPNGSNLQENFEMSSNARLVSLATVVIVAGCSPKDAPKAADSTSAPAPAAATAAMTTPNVVNIATSEYKFDAPDQIPAGMTTFHLTDTGKEPHQAGLIKLDSGKTVADFMAGLKNTKPGTPPPGWVMAAGGPNAIAPGGSMDLTTNLAAGNYALVCFVPDAKGVPHVMKGMGKALTVTPNAAASTAAPASDVSVTLSDFKFDFSVPLTAGKHTIKIETAPGQPHEFTLFQLMPGKTAADVAKYFDGDMKGPPPAMPVGGVAALGAGNAVYYPVDLKPGDYALVCFLPDGKDGKPHFSHGMLQALKVS